MHTVVIPFGRGLQSSNAVAGSRSKWKHQVQSYFLCKAQSLAPLVPGFLPPPVHFLGDNNPRVSHGTET